MHDGHFFSLFKVMDHYINGIDTTKALLDPSLRKKINLTNKEKTELIYFLYTLTDSSFIKNTRFAPDFIPEIKNPHH
jgi:cytochrome c peroxidase